MNRNDYENMLDGIIQMSIETLGFERRTCLSYQRIVNEAVARIGCVGRLDPRGFYAFTFGVGLYYNAISKWIDDKASDRYLTIGTPIHFLRPNTNYTEWKFSNSDELEELSGELIYDLNTYAIPYFKQYSMRLNLRNAVESECPDDWVILGLNQDSRIIILAAIYMEEGNKSKALKVLDNALALRKTAMPKRRYEIANMRQRIYASVSH